MGLFDIFRRKKEEAKQQDVAVEAQQQEELSQGLEKTKQGFFSKLARAVAGRDKVDDVVLDQLEEVLITSDVGVETTVRIIERIEERVSRDKYMNTAELQGILRGEIAALLQESAESQENFGIPMREGEPYVGCVHTKATCSYCDMVAIDDHTAGLVYSDFTILDGDGQPRKCMMFRTVTVEE